MEVKYIYMIKTHEFVRTNENIFKIGRTEQLNYNRFNAYRKGSILLFQSICKNCHECEKIIIKKFKEEFIHRTDIGNEYFEGNYNEMINMLCDIVSHENCEHIESKLSTLCELYVEKIAELKMRCDELANDLKNQTIEHTNKLTTLHEMYTKEIDDLKNDLKFQTTDHKNKLSFLHDIYGEKLDKHKIEVVNITTKCDKLENNIKFQIKIINEIIEYDSDELLDYNALSKYTSINWEIIEANPDKPWNYKYLSKNLNVTWEIIKSNPNKSWNYRYLSENHNITWEIIKENIDKPWSYLGLSANPNITLEIAKLNPNHPWDYNLLECRRNIIKKITVDCYYLVHYEDIYNEYLRELIN
jgi:hypothetical protein